MKYNEYNDYELIYMVRENGSESSSLLLEKYNPIIKNIVNDYYLRFSNFSYDYDDFFQEALLAFYNALYTYDDDKNCLFYTYVVLCVKRALLSFSRNISSINKNLSFYNYIDIDLLQIPDDRCYIDDMINYEELNSIIRNMLFDLPFEFSTAIELKLNGFKYREIEILLDVPRSTVQFRCRKGFDILKNNLRKYRK